MRYRKLSSTGDYTFGGDQRAFLINSPETVAQAIRTRLDLWLGQWFVDTSDGTNWLGGVLGKYTRDSRDAVVQARILGTTGVIALRQYASQFNGETRIYSVQAVVDTIFGEAFINVGATAP